MPTPAKGYHLASGEQVPGTTTIIGRFKDSGALLFWAFKRGKEGANRLYDNIATDVGTAVHAMVEADLHGNPPPPWPDNFDGAMKQAASNAFENYKRELARTKAFVMPLEVQLISERYRYGGTPDAIVEFDGEVQIGDWKSAANVYLDHVIQLAAYRQLWNENHPDQMANGGRIYRFSKESGVFAEHSYGVETLDLAFRQFVLFREAYDLDQKLKKKI
jgi:hypothetical protein